MVTAQAKSMSIKTVSFNRNQKATSKALKDKKKPFKRLLFLGMNVFQKNLTKWAK